MSLRRPQIKIEQLELGGVAFGKASPKMQEGKGPSGLPALVGGCDAGQALQEPGFLPLQGLPPPPLSRIGLESMNFLRFD